MSQSTYRLWEEAPRREGDGPEDSPQVTVHLASEPNGCGVIVCPGGGYRTLASDHEGLQVAQWFNQLGIHAFVLRYRLGPRYHSQVSKLDGQRAVRLVRHFAARWGLDPERVGMLGFSAGGHLALAAALDCHDTATDNSQDEIDKQDCRPNFVVPVYAVTNGEKRGRKAVEYLSMDTLVTADSPPTFIVHNHQDSVVPANQATLLYDALLAARVPAELHIFNFGDHGLGLNRGADPVDMKASPWGELLRHWMQRTGFLFEQSGESGRCEVKGEVLLDGVPVGLGWLTWVPDDRNLPVARTRLTAAGFGRFHLEAPNGPVPGAYRLLLHVVSAVYPATATGDYTMQQALMFETRVEVASGTWLQWHLNSADSIAF